MRTLPAKWQTMLGYLRLVVHPVGLTSLGALVIIALMELEWASARHVFSSYPVTIGLVTGLLTLIFTLSVVNRIIDRRDEIRWQDIRGITLKGLNDEVRATRDILWIAIFGCPAFGVSKQTEAAYEMAQHSGIVWPDPSPGKAAEQLMLMQSDADWTKTAAGILRLATEQVREGLVRWAPMTALARGDYRVLSPVATLADVLEVMEYPFDNKRRDDGKNCVDAYFHNALCDLWLHAITTCVYVEENIVRTLYPVEEYPERGSDPWTSGGPRERMLSVEALDELDGWLKDSAKFRAESRVRELAITTKLKPPW
jgi:hypothetical protein